MTHPSVETAQSGQAADAVRTLQAELRGDYTGIRSAEIELTEAILTAHAVTVSGRNRLQDIQRQLIEAINNPVTALDTPAGERQFLMFLKRLVAEIQDIVDTGALSDEDHANVTRALASGYLLNRPEREPTPPVTGQAAGGVPALGSALGSLPQAAAGPATAPAQGASGLAGAATPLAGLASGLLERAGEQDLPEDRAELEPPDDTADVDERGEAESDDDAEDDDDDADDDRPSTPPPEGDREPREHGPAQTRPAGSRQEAP